MPHSGTLFENIHCDDFSDPGPDRIDPPSIQHPQSDCFACDLRRVPRVPINPDSVALFPPPPTNINVDADICEPLSTPSEGIAYLPYIAARFDPAMTELATPPDINYDELPGIEQEGYEQYKHDPLKTWRVERRLTRMAFDSDRGALGVWVSLYRDYSYDSCGTLQNVSEEIPFYYDGGGWGNLGAGYGGTDPEEFHAAEEMPGYPDTIPALIFGWRYDGQYGRFLYAWQEAEFEAHYFNPQDLTYFYDTGGRFISARPDVPGIARPGILDSYNEDGAYEFSYPALNGMENGNNLSISPILSGGLDASECMYIITNLYPVPIRGDNDVFAPYIETAHSGVEGSEETWPLDQAPVVPLHACRISNPAPNLFLGRKYMRYFSVMNAFEGICDEWDHINCLPPGSPPPADDDDPADSPGAFGTGFSHSVSPRRPYDMDAILFKGQPTQNFSWPSDGLEVGYSSAGVGGFKRIILTMWLDTRDFAYIDIVSAVLKLRVYQYAALWMSPQEIYSVPVPPGTTPQPEDRNSMWWQHHQVSWNNYKTGSAWSTPGGDLGPDVTEFAPPTDAEDLINDVLEIDITKHVRAVFDADSLYPSNPITLIIKDKFENPYYTTSWKAYKGTSDEASYRPIIEFTYNALPTKIAEAPTMRLRVSTQVGVYRDPISVSPVTLSFGALSPAVVTTPPEF